MLICLRHFISGGSPIRIMLMVRNCVVVYEIPDVDYSLAMQGFFYSFTEFEVSVNLEWDMSISDYERIDSSQMTSIL